jgi:hypothetical protein
MTISITSRFGTGGSGLTPAGEGSPTLAEALRAIATDEAAFVASGNGRSLNGILGGGLLTDPGSSAQAAGTGATTWNVDVSALDVLVNGVYAHVAAATPFAVHAATCLVIAGQSVYAWLVALNMGGAITVAVVEGTAAATGSEAIPTDAAITAACTVGTVVGTWVKLGLLHLTRDAGVNLVQTQDMTYRQEHGGNAISAVAPTIVAG